MINVAYDSDHRLGMQRIFHIYCPADWFRVGENLFVEKERKRRDG